MHIDFHSVVQMLLFLGSIGAIPTGIALKIHWLWPLGIGGIFLYPVLLELLVYSWVCISHTENGYKKSLQARRLKMANYQAIVYREGYNLEACGLEKKHPFDALKYRR